MKVWGGSLASRKNWNFKKYVKMITLRWTVNEDLISVECDVRV